MIRKGIFWAGWVAMLVYSVIFVVQGWILQDIPPIAIWKWAVLGATVILIYSSRNTDEVFTHHLPH